MQAVLTADELTLVLGSLTEELHQFLSRLYAEKLTDADRTRLDALVAACRELADKAQNAREMAGDAWDSFGERVANARDAAAARRQTLGESLERMSTSLRSMAAELAEHPRVARVRSWRNRLSTNYEDLLRSVRRSRVAQAGQPLQLPHLKPANYHRNVFHVAMGLVSVLLYELVLTWPLTMLVLGSISTVVVTLEVTRKIWPRWNQMICDSIFFRLIIRPRELRRINSASVYALTLTGMCLLAPMPAVEVGLLVLAFGDPAASIIGKRWGSRKLWRQKSWAGSAAFFGVAFGVSVLFLGLKGLLAPWSMVGVAAAAAFAGTVTELLSDRLDDNFSVLAMTTAVTALFFM